MSISESTFFRGVPDTVRERLLEASVRKSYPAGTIIFTEGERHDDFHLVESGHARLEMAIPRRGRTPVLTVGPGDALAWSAVLGDGIMTASAVAMEDVVTEAVSGPALRALCEADPLFGYHMMRQLSSALSRRLVATRLQLLDLFVTEFPTAQRPSQDR